MGKLEHGVVTMEPGIPFLDTHTSKYVLLKAKVKSWCT